MPRILIIEDDRRLSDFVRRALEEAGHVVAQAFDGPEGLVAATREEFDVMVLDRMLPGVDGLKLLEERRATGDATPVLIVSALSEVDQRVQGLRAGGDDYLVKPFAVVELLARVDALCRRSTPDSRQTTLRVGSLEMDLLAHTVSLDGETIELRLKEFRLLEYLVRHAGESVTRTMLLDAVWGIRFDPGTNLVDVHVGRLRKRLEGLPGAPVIDTVRGVGYRLRPQSSDDA